jgi:hypothetical protein
MAHRWVWEQANGPIPSGMFVCHHCDNPSCVNLEHLFLGSPADNMADKVAKGRQWHPNYGEQHHNARLTNAEVTEIRRLYEKGVDVRAGTGRSARELSKRFGVSVGYVHAIINRQERPRG